ncbi:MAG TPA: trypsin-like serine protease [Fimbriiglobus sp.]|nr:trypsin-like serine protease [Fimbriiglobus sp.]
MCRHLLAVALLLALAAPAPAGVIAGYDPASQASHDTYDRFASGFPTAPVPNSSSAFVAAGIDLSGVGWLAGDPKFAVTLISPRHILGANHVGFPGGQVQFVNAAGQVKTYTVMSTTRLTTPGQTQPSDLLLGTLSAAIPAADGIRYIGVAGVTAAQAVGLPMLAYGQNPAYAPSPHLGTNVINGVSLESFNNPSDPDQTRVMTYDWAAGVPGEMYLIGGDSGGPAFVRADGDLALAGVHYGVSRSTNDPQPGDFSASTFVPEYITGLNAAMAGSGFQVTVVPVPEPAGLLAFAALAVTAGVVRRVSRRRPRSGCPAPR